MKSIIAIALLIVILFVTGSLQQNFNIGDAELITAPGSIPINNMGADAEASLSLCGKLTDASSFIWFKIEASSSLRVFTFDTCDVGFDSVMGVFVGTDTAGVNDLQTLGCNDDRDTARSSCDAFSSLLQYMSVEAGETVYIVIGGYKGDEASPSVGSGHLYVSVLDPTDLECSSDVIIQAQIDLQNEIASSKTSITDSIGISNEALALDISNAQTAVITAITASQTTLSSSLSALQTAVGTVGDVLDDTADTVDAISSVLDTVNDNVNGALSQVNTEIDANIAIVSSAIQTLSNNVDDSFVALDAKVTGIETIADAIDDTLTQLSIVVSDIEGQQSDLEDEVGEFQMEVSGSFQTLENNLAEITSDLQTANSDLSAINGDITAVDTRVNAIKSSVDELSTDVDGDFITLNTNIDQANTLVDNILIVTNNIADSDESIIGLNMNIIAQITSFSNGVDDAFAGMIEEVGDVSDAVGAAASSIQSSFTSMQSKISDIQNINDDIDDNVIQINSILGDLNGELQADSARSIFINTVIRYLSDSSTAEPLTLRIPNVFGGRLDDVSAYVVSQFNALKNAANLVGEKGSPNCAASPSCTFFFTVAEPSYTTSFAKFTANVNARRFTSAFTYLRQAFISLYPFAL